MKIYIKNMVCTRCKMVVKAELKRLGLRYYNVELGEVDIKDNITSEQFHQLSISLAQWGLELMADKRNILVEKIIACIIELVQDTDDEFKVNHADYLKEKLNFNYTYLAHVFSEVKGTTIEKFYLAHKIDKIKYLLVNDKLSLSEISYRLNYSSVAHLSHQFKKITGLTPSSFKNISHTRFASSFNV